MLARFATFVNEFIHTYLVPLRPDSCSVDERFNKWLDRTAYAEHRKQELRDAYDMCHGHLHPRHYRVQSHLKREFYESYKYPRCINSRSDAFKACTGPLFHMIEREVFYKQETKMYFVKSLPVPERSLFLKRRLGDLGYDFLCTDFSSFDASLNREVMMVCEMQLYKYMTMYIDGGAEFYTHVERALTGVNHCRNREFGRFSVRGTRMSGDMCTSLGNGFTNLCVSLFVANQTVPWEHLDGIFEGDDGVVRVPHGAFVEPAYYANLGFKIKLVRTSRLGDVVFCQTYFDPDECVNIIDPVRHMLKFGWSLSAARAGGREVVLGLLRAKALSLLYSAPGCPVLQSLAQYALRVTDGVVPRWDDTDLGWKLSLVPKGTMEGAQSRPVSMRSRQVVEDHFHYPIDHQVAAEAFLDGLDDLQPLPSWLVPCANDDCYDAYDRDVENITQQLEMYN